MAAVAVMLFAGCSKDIESAGTKWQSNYSNTITYQGMAADFNMDLTLNFTDATNYTLDVDAVISFMGMSIPYNADPEAGTYTFDGVNGMFDGEQAFTYNEDNNTISVTLASDDGEFSEMFGSNSVNLTFTEVK